MNNLRLFEVFFRFIGYLRFDAIVVFCASDFWIAVDKRLVFGHCFCRVARRDGLHIEIDWCRHECVDEEGVFDESIGFESEFPSFERGHDRDGDGGFTEEVIIGFSVNFGAGGHARNHDVHSEEGQCAFHSAKRRTSNDQFIACRKFFGGNGRWVMRIVDEQLHDDNRGASNYPHDDEDEEDRIEHRSVVVCTDELLGDERLLRDGLCIGRRHFGRRRLRHAAACARTFSHLRRNVFVFERIVVECRERNEAFRGVFEAQKRIFLDTFFDNRPNCRIA